MSAQLLPLAVLALQPLQFGTHYPLAFAVLLLQTLSVAFSKLIASSRPTAPLSRVPQIRPLADIVHFKYAPTYFLTYLLTTWLYCVLLSITVRALGDKSEVPLLEATLLPSVDTQTQDFDADAESKLGDLAIGPETNADDESAAACDGNIIDVECEGAIVSSLEAVATNIDGATVELSTSDAVAANSNCEPEADLPTDHVTVGPDLKGEIELHRILITTKMHLILLFIY